MYIATFFLVTSGVYLKFSKSQKQIMVSSILLTNVRITLCTENYPNVRFLGELKTPY